MKNLGTIIKRREGLIITLILALATFFRLFRLGHQSLWIYEINAIIIANKNIFKILFFKDITDTTPPFIYAISHFWHKLGNTDFIVRFPSVAFGILSIYAAYKLAKVLLGKKEALFTAFLISVSLYHIIYSQEAVRPYAAFLLFSLLSLYCLCQILKTNQKKYLVGFIIFNVLNFYTQFFTIFVLVGEIIIWSTFIFRNSFRKENNFRLNINKIFRLGYIVILILILSSPIIKMFFVATEYELAGGRVALNPIYYKNLLCRYGAGNGLAFFIYNLFFLSGLTSLFKGNKRKEVFLLIFCLIFPFLVLSFMELKHFFHIRYVIFTYPLYVIIVSKGITNILDMKLLKPLKQKALLLIIIIFLGLSFNPLRLYYQMPARLTDWRGAADYIYNTAQDGAKVITQEWHDNLIKYYLAKKHSPKKIEVTHHHNNVYYFADILSNNYNQELYCVAYGEDIGYGTDEFSMLAEQYFKNKVVFFSPVYLELGKRELIDWDGNSWLDIGVRGYRLVVYFNNKN